MTTAAFTLDRLTESFPSFDLMRNELLMIRRGGDAGDALKKAHARARKMALGMMPHLKGFDSVKEVRKWRSGEAK